MPTTSIIAAFAYGVLAQAGPTPGYVYTAGYGPAIGRDHQFVKTEAGPVEGLGQVTQAEGGNNFSIALRTNGTVCVWGDSTEGQLGQGNTKHVYSPAGTTVIGLPAIKQIRAGLATCYAVSTGGDVFAWGVNNSTFGPKTTINKSGTPIQVAGITGVQSLAVGNGFAVALKPDGKVWTWGSNAQGGLGDGTTGVRREPTVIPNLSNVTQIAVAGFRAFALKSDGTVWAWGVNSGGTLGVGNTTYLIPTPTQVAGASLIKEIAVGFGHTVLLRDNGTVMTFGLNDMWQLGNPAIPDTYPGTAQAALVPGLANVKHIGAGGSSSFAIAEDGTASVFGRSEGFVPEFRSAAPVVIPHVEKVLSAGGGQYHGVLVSGTSTPLYGWASPNPVVGPFGPSNFRIAMPVTAAHDIPLSLTSDDPAATIPAIATIPAGSDHIDVQITTPIKVAATRYVTLRAAAGSPSAVASMQIDDQRIRLYTSSDLSAGDLGGGSVTLNFPAPAGGAKVLLSTDTPSAITLPPSTTVPEGQMVGTFTFPTQPNSNGVLLRVYADYDGHRSETNPYIKGNPLGAVTVSASEVKGGETLDVKVLLAQNAPAGGTAVTLLKGSEDFDIPSTITVPAGQKTGSAIVQTHRVKVKTTGYITAYVNGSYPKAVAFGINPAALSTLTLRPATVKGGVSAKLDIVLDAPSAGSTIALSSSDPSVTVPATVNIGAGKTTAVVTVTTTALTASKYVTIRAKLDDKTLTTKLLVTAPAPALSSVTFAAPSVKSGKSVTGTVTLEAPAFVEGVVVKLKLTDPTKGTVPETVKIGSGKTTATFKFTAAATTSTVRVVLVASANGISKKANLTVTP